MSSAFVAFANRNVPLYRLVDWELVYRGSLISGPFPINDPFQSEKSFFAAIAASFSPSSNLILEEKSMGEKLVLAEFADSGGTMVDSAAAFGVAGMDDCFHCQINRITDATITTAR